MPVVITRHWDNPEIEILVTNKWIGISMELDDFIYALAQESGNPATLLTINALHKRLKTASEEVCNKMKHETVKVV